MNEMDIQPWLIRMSQGDEEAFQTVYDLTRDQAFGNDLRDRIHKRKSIFQVFGIGLVWAFICEHKVRLLFLYSRTSFCLYVCLLSVDRKGGFFYVAYNGLKDGSVPAA